MAATTALLAAAGPAWAEASEPGDDLTVYALTFGPGDHPFFKFGHNALLVERRHGEGLVYNFGTFAFDSPALIPKFLRGKFMYWLSVAGERETMMSYAAANRSILAQELDLTPAQRWALWQGLRENARPENREYLYDYFYDNCSTRVRDAIDKVVGGRVRAAGQARVPMTFRDHALRMTADLWPEAVGIDLALGRAADVPLDRWDEAFLPERLADLLRQVRIPDVSGQKNLVKSERMVFRDVRPATPARPPNWTLYFLAVGGAIGGAFFTLGRLSRAAAARVVLGCAASLTGLVLGLLGLILLSLWLLTNHRIAYANANIMQLAPWSVGLAGYGLKLIWAPRRAARAAAALALSAVVFSLLGVVCKLAPGLNQNNWPFVALCLPLWLGLWGGLRALRTRVVADVGQAERLDPRASTRRASRSRRNAA
ncbi:MAG: DUF4105 domain-containing protein [Polyangia bacterium]